MPSFRADNIAAALLIGSNCLELMSSNLLYFINREYLTQLAVNRIKYELLQEQINPYLLYNTLSFFSYSAKITENNELSKLADNLIVFYKAALNRGEIISTLEDEIEIIRSYISITIAIYELNIQVIFDIDATLLSCCTIKLILQPVVENAIIHGIKPNKCGVLTIRCKQEGENLLLSVEDDGVGLDKDAKEVFDKIISCGMYEKAYGIGNVIHRIHLFFGKEYGLRIESSP